jgi:hypothetical protein
LPPYNIHTTTYYTEFDQSKPKLACNSEGTDEIPEDGTQLPKHVGAAKWKLIIIDAFVGYFQTYDATVRINKTGNVRAT